MTVTYDQSLRAPPPHQMATALEDRFEVMKEIGDGSFGSVVLARVRTAGANVARRGTMVSRNPFHTAGPPSVGTCNIPYL